MATPFHVQVQPSQTGLLKYQQDTPGAETVSKLLQEDMEKHHVFFNADGFHNHIPHQLLTLYATGASPSTLQKAYASNASYQHRAFNPSESILAALQSDFPSAYAQYRGKGRNYASFLQFFQLEIEAKGWKDVLSEYVFRENDESRDLFARLYAGFLHPMIQLLFGVEYEQPAIVAEALAQAAVHDNRLGPLFTEAEKRADETNPPYKPLVEFIDEIYSDEKHAKLRASAQFTDPNKIYDGIMKRAPDEALEIISKVKVNGDDLEERTVEMVHNAAYVAAAASWHPPNIPKFDFFLIHHLTSAPIFLILARQDWIPQLFKVRLLEWKMRLDILQYVARGSPPLSRDIIQTYTPKETTSLVSSAKDLLPRFHNIIDDGHVIKVVRSLLIAEDESQKYQGKEWVRIRPEDWVRVHYMLLRSAEGQDTEWVRATGFPEAWKDVPLEN